MRRAAIGYLDLSKKLETVNTRESLADFVRSMADDYERSKNNWENTTVDRCLEALSAVIIGIEFGYKNAGKSLPENPNWKLMVEEVYGPSRRKKK